MIKGIGEQLHRTLKEKIVALEMSPGERINFPDLCEEFGVSLSPVREAVKKLCESGLVEFFPRRGYYIFKPTCEDVKNIYALRLMFEHYALQSFDQENPGDTEELERLYRLAQTAVDTGKTDRADLLRTEDIHVFIIRHSENVYMRNLFFGTIYDFTVLFQHFVDRNIEEFVHHHMTMAEALLKGNINIAHQTMDQHINKATVEICRSVKARQNQWVAA